MICPDCMKEVSDDCNFCVHCGFNLKEYNRLYPIIRERVEFFVNNDEVIQGLLNGSIGLS